MSICLATRWRNHKIISIPNKILEMAYYISFMQYDLSLFLTASLKLDDIVLWLYIFIWFINVIIASVSCTHPRYITRVLKEMWRLSRSPCKLIYITPPGTVEINKPVHIRRINFCLKCWCKINFKGLTWIL